MKLTKLISKFFMIQENNQETVKSNQKSKSIINQSFSRK